MRRFSLFLDGALYGFSVNLYPLYVKKMKLIPAKIKKLYIDGFR